jgi:hypothetical protein
LDETCILEREIVDRIEKEMSRRAHFLESFSQKRDEIIEYTPTFQGRQKMIKCVRSSRKDLAALERDRTKERERDRRLFSSRQSPLSHSRKLGFPRRARDRRREEEHHHHHPKAIGSLFFLFFSL